VPIDENLRLDHQLCVALYHASRAVIGCYRPALDELGLTYSQYTVMLVLWEHERTTMRELGRLLHLDSATLSPVLKRMEQAGLLERERDENDERVLNVNVTTAGKQLQKRASEVQQGVEKATGLSGSELADLRDRLNDLAARLRAADC
jgi:DNA-binding MarR family transcriptional regulator